MAPFTPFLSEFIFLELNKLGLIKEESVHLCDYPTSNEKEIYPELEDAVGRIQQIILLGRQKRNQVQIKTKTPLANLTIIHKDKELLSEISKLETYLKSELNIKNISYSEDEEKFIRIYAKPNSPVLGKRLGKRFGKFRKVIESLTTDQLVQLEESKEITLDGEKFFDSDFLFFREAKEGTQALSNRFISIDIDCNLTPDLIDEGLAREVVNRIQKTRKELNFNIDDRVDISYSGDETLLQAIDKFSSYIKGETLANNLSFKKHNPDSILFEIESKELYLTIKR